MAEKRTAEELDTDGSDESGLEYKVKFKSEWEKLYPVRCVKNDPHYFLCIPCNKQIGCSHQGLKDIEDHCACC